MTSGGSPWSCLAASGLAGDSYLTAILAEHLKFSGLLKNLTSEELAVLGQAAKKHKLSAYLGDLPAGAPDLPPVQDSLDQTAVEGALDAVADALADGVTGDALRQTLAHVPAFDSLLARPCSTKERTHCR